MSGSATLPSIETHVRAVLDAAPDPTLLIDRHGRIAYASGRVADLTGRAPADLIGAIIDTLAPARLREAFAHFRGEMFARPGHHLIGFKQPIYALHADGRETPVEIALNTLVLGEETYAVASVRDISPRVGANDVARLAAERLQERLASAYTQVRQLMEHTPAPVAMLDREMRYLNASRRWIEDFGLGDADIIGKSHYALFPDLPERWKEAHRRCLAGEVLTRAEDYYVRDDGAVMWLRWELQPWLALDGSIGGLIIFSEVITERKRAQEALRAERDALEMRVAERTALAEAARNEAVRANELKSRFVAAASHDLRQPVHAAQLFLDALRLRLQTPEQIEICGKAQRAMGTLAGILEALLDASRLERGVVQPRLSTFALSELIGRIVAHSGPRAEQKGLAIRFEGGACRVRSDPALLERVVDNLVANAIRYTDAGEVSICCAQEGDVVRIAVRDTGPGIPAEARERIFEEYVQLENAAGRRGAGLGLSIARQLAALIGARIELDSAEGEGSTFSVLAPAANAPAA